MLVHHHRDRRPRHSRGIVQHCNPNYSVPTLCVCYLYAMQVCMALSQLSKHSLDLAEAVTEASNFAHIFSCLLHPDGNVSAAAASLIREVVKHSADLAQMAASAGAVGKLVECLEVRCLVRRAFLTCTCFLCSIKGQACVLDYRKAALF